MKSYQGYKEAQIEITLVTMILKHQPFLINLALPIFGFFSNCVSSMLLRLPASPSLRRFLTPVSNKTDACAWRRNFLNVLFNLSNKQNWSNKAAVHCQR